jgi:CxxC-x17-CxxC domain-containing protein
MYTDKTLTCRDCGAEFTFTASEQAFFAEKGFTNDPSRCPSCRANRRNSGGGRNDRNGGFSGTRQMYDVVCSGCGRHTQVPFEPRGDRPVYCRDCFEKKNSRY